MKDSLSPKLNRQIHGVALVIVLALVVLLTIMVTAFFSRAILNQQISNSSAGQAKADNVAQSALSYITSDLRQEMNAGSKADGNPAGAAYTVGGVRIFIPKTNKSVVPVRIGTDDTLTNLTRRSVRSDTATADAFPTQKTTFPAADYDATLLPKNRASASSTTSPSQNQRTISIDRWNKPLLLSGGAIPARFTAPDWVILTRNGPKAFSTWDASLKANTPNNNNFAIGRYAYTVYDEGGLLDINVAGNALPTAENMARGRMHQASLAELKDSSGTSLIPNPSALIAWRSAGSGANLSSTPGSGGLFDPRRTFLNVVNGTPSDQTFLGRQDLINYVQANSTIILKDALPFIGTFSRESNAPSWTPGFNSPAGAPYNYLDSAESSTANIYNRNLATVRFGSSGTIPGSPNGGNGNFSERIVQVGEPVLKRRFPLSRLGWIGRTGPANGATAEDVKRAFGLTFTNLGIWTYTSPDAITRAPRIKTLNEVGATNPLREPDFFELLQAGILHGSLGLANDPNDGTIVYRTNADTRDMDRSKSRQIVQIGVNIIDQYDSDSWPTTILFDWFDDPDFTPGLGSPYTPTSNTPYLKGLYPGIVGMENIPYLYNIFQTYYKHPMLGGGDRVGIFQMVEMWNPYAPPSVAGTGPTKFRVRVEAGNSLFTQNNNLGVTVDCKYPFNYDGSTTNGVTGPQEIVMDTASESFSNPKVLSNLNSVGPPTWPISGTRTDNGQVLVPGSIWLIPGGWHDAFMQQYRFEKIFNSSKPGPTFRVDYQNEDSTWSQYPYQLLPEYCWYNDDPGNGAVKSTLWWDEYLRGAFRPDPRGVRWGLTQGGGNWRLNMRVPSGDGSSYSRPSNKSSAVAPGTLYTSSYGGSADGVLPFNNINNWQNGEARMGHLAFNKAGSTRTEDIDGVLRSADYFVGGNDAVTPMDSTATDVRPVILNRPFRTVGELGYVFRDQPWKTLDLATANSADSALLDIFSVNDSDSQAGALNINTRHAAVLQAILAGSIKVSSSNGALAASEAKRLSDALVALTLGPSGPLLNVSELATRFLPAISDVTTAPLLKTQRETAVRTLAEIASAKVWNVMVDVVAQSGQYSPGATNLDQFIVDGERRYWLHIALDRFTGKIVDQRLELVSE